MSSQPDNHRDPSAAHGVPAALHQIRREVRDLSQTWWAARDRAELMDTVAEIEAVKSTLDALQLGVVGELEATTDRVMPEYSSRCLGTQGARFEDGLFGSKRGWTRESSV